MEEGGTGSTRDALDSPIFVVGPSRSGTTLVRSILNAHPAVSIAPETHYFDDLRPRLGARALAPLEDTDVRSVERYFLALRDTVYGQETSPGQTSIDSGELRREAHFLGGTADAYFEAFCRRRMRALGKSRWGEKTPRHVFRIAEMLDLWPEAKVVCLVRDPRAVVASYRDWKRGKPDSSVPDRLRATRSYHPVVSALLVKGAVEASQQARRRFGAERILLLRYEELVTEPERSVRTLAEWIGVDYESSMLGVSDKYGSYGDVSGGISQAPLERWRSKLSPTELSVIQTCCRGTMEQAGYQRERVSPPLLELVRTWASVPVAVGRAGLANRKRLGRTSEYILKRVRLAFSRRG
jgi:sulfotransferase family protein